MRVAITTISPSPMTTEMEAQANSTTDSGVLRKVVTQKAPKARSGVHKHSSATCGRLGSERRTRSATAGGASASELAWTQAWAMTSHGPEP